MERPNCYQCVHRRELPGDAHSRCNNINANVVGHEHGKVNGWFSWPYNFDPVWLEKCDGFSENPKDKLPEQKGDTLSELFSILR
jgi:hypothetical protein